LAQAILNRALQFVGPLYFLSCVAPMAGQTTMRLPNGRPVSAEEYERVMGRTAERSDKVVQVGRERFTEAQIAAGQAQISAGNFMVGVKGGQMDALVGAAKEQFPGWAPATVLDAMPMFMSMLDQDKVLWFLRRDEVKYIEADGQCSIATCGTGEQGAPPPTAGAPLAAVGVQGAPPPTTG